MHIPKVLLVNNDPASLLALENLLAPDADASGYELVMAASADAALREVLRHDFAVILLDVRMPDMDGFDTAAAIRSHPRSAVVPVVFIAAASAAASDQALRLQAYQHGAADYLCAPLEPLVVQAKVRTFVELTRKHLQLQAQAEESRRITAELRSQRLQDLERSNRELELEVAERKQAEQRAHELSTKDPLTGLVNRRSLIQHLEHAVASCDRRRSQFALLFLDLDEFKQINDGFGHDVGDELLRQVAARLSAAVRASDVVARLGGDEFVVLIEGKAPGENAARVARKIAHAHARPFSIGGHRIHTSTSIGIAVYPHDGASARALMKNADLAMYRAKEEREHPGRGGGQGGNMRFFHEEMNRREHERELWTGELRHALSHGQLALLYQPLVRLGGGGVGGVEAKLVWNHPRLGRIDAAAFVPAVQDRGLLERVDSWMMAAVCAQAAAWRGPAGTGPLATGPLATARVALNLVAPALGPDLPARLLAEVRRHLLPAGAIVLELSETLLGAHHATIEPLLRQLQANGVLLALDDFGHSGTSLAACKKLGLDILKIDDAFVRNIGDDAGGTDLVAAIVHLARALSMEVTATGVAHPHQLAVLATLGCDNWQGALFCAPLGAAELAQALPQLNLADLLEQHS
ncbi:putative bifunctional diguanylate cyclase/phosphodiesterase [Pseudoduganella umbonata]|uniref:Diguanylate cyclase (GGDEF)-like protein n=1 Tax=Pseudoduganella umbonata TaxID=864828 RepID=A0A4P8HPZ9_9BURK|nr:EAL domain-containing protein [Pseudoduganella umbonata]MBB3221481.1 diguanylate cyclase (GGDEF)-like protein [Pseudoduganella umbonata]QCP10632.1 EAL domain-containing protein [Pseudoduganella umbonata]